MEHFEILFGHSQSRQVGGYYLVADCHVGLVHVCPLASITMKPLNCVGCQSPMARNIVLWTSSHVIQESSEPFRLGFACEGVSSFVLVVLF
jgi:hypothetical protein